MKTILRKSLTNEPLFNSKFFNLNNYDPLKEAESIKQINENPFKKFHNNLRYNDQSIPFQQENITLNIKKKSPKINTIIDFSSEKLLREYSSEMQYLLIYSVLIIFLSILIFTRDIIFINIYKNTNSFILSLILSIFCFSFISFFIILIFKKTMRDKYKFLCFRVYSIALVCLIFFTFCLEPLIFLDIIAKIKDKKLKCLQLEKENKICDPYHINTLIILSGVIIICILILIKFLISLLIRSIKILNGNEKEAVQKELDSLEK